VSGTIICMVDSSHEAETAVDVARHLANRFDARILLVSIADGLAPTKNGAREEHRVAAGDPAEAVAVIAAEEAADLVVVGARRGLLGRTVGDGLARELAATAPCPVVVALPVAAAGGARRASFALPRDQES
jgi:nucleotide-binding universal stress UspA family protein